MRQTLDMDYGIFNMYTWSFCMQNYVRTWYMQETSIYSPIQRTFVESAQDLTPVHVQVISLDQA